MQAVYMISAAALFVPALYHMTTEETRGPQNPNAPGMCLPPSLTILYLQECRNTCGLPLSGVLYWAKGNLLNEDMWVQASLLMAWYS